ncbi:MAG: TonB-dependent receptor [Pseudomonadota bacterium]
MKRNLARFGLIGTSTLAIACVASANAYAQDAEPAAAASNPVDVITVTALKRETVLADTPLAVSVLSGESLNEAGVQTILDLQNVAPSVQIGTGPLGVTVNIRGVTTTDLTSKGQQGIAVNVDGVAIGRPREMGAAFFDLERIEVLRGPQGTLYGRSTTGGVINIITKRPGSEFSASADLEYGNFDTKRVEAAVNVPVTDNFALRGAVAYNERDGYLPARDADQDYDDQDDLSFRVSALYDFNDTTSLFVTSTFGESNGVGSGEVPISNFIPVGRGIMADEVVTVSSPSGKSGRSVFGVPDALIPSVDEDYVNVTTEFNTAFKGVALTYLFGYRDYDTNTFTAQTLAPSPLAGPPPPLFVWEWGQYRGTNKTKQHEIRFSNDNPGRLNWILGFNRYKEEIEESDHPWASPVTAPTREAAISAINVLGTTEQESLGVFGQVDFGLTDTVNLTAGVRYSEDEVDRRGTFATGPFQVDANGDPCVFPADCVGVPNNGAASADKVTWRVGLDWKPTETALLYGSIATGYKAGGFNDFDPVTGGIAPYDPEELIAYEIGFKGEILPNLNLESAAFYYDYSDAQITTLTNVSGSVVIFTQIAGVEVYGWENDFTWTPTDQDTVRFGFSLMDGEYTDYTAGARNPGDFPPIGALFTDWSGRSIEKVSDFTARLEYSREFYLPNSGVLALRLASRYDSGYIVSNFTDAFQLEQDGYTRSDANLTYRHPGDYISFGLFVRNIENEVQITSAPLAVPPGAENSAGVNVTEPRVFGARLGVSY